MNTIRCKFFCQSVTKYHRDRGQPFVYEARFMPVYTGSDENKRFFDATPSGELKIGMFRDDVFQPGKEYYLDVTLAETAS